MNIKKIAQTWVQGLSLGIKIALMGMLTRYVIIFIIGVTAAYSGSFPPLVAMTLVGIKAQKTALEN